MTKTLLWKYIKDDAERIVLGIERLKSLVQIALEMDHLYVSFWIRKLALLTASVNCP
jgi:hypothetical protein